MPRPYHISLQDNTTEVVDDLRLCLQAGVVSSSNNLGYSDADWAQMQTNQVAVKEMEGAGIAWAAHLFGTPLFALKSITDIVDGERPPQEEFLENLGRAAVALKVSFYSFAYIVLLFDYCD